MQRWLVSLFLAWVGGIIAGSSVPLWVVGVGTLGAGVFLWKWRWPIPLLAGCAGLILLGGIWGIEADAQEPLPCGEETSETWTGEVKQVWRYASTQAQYLISHPSGCRVLLTAPRFPEWRVGDTLEFSGTLQAVRDIPPPYESYAEYLHRRGIAATLRFPAITRVAAGPGSIADMWRKLDGRLHRLLPEPEASVSAALLYGWQGTIPEDVQERFRQTGMTHILAVSGMHVTIVVGALSVLGFLPLPRLARLGLMIAAVWIYIETIGAPISAVRAGWFWMGLLVAWKAGRLASLPSVVLVSSAGMLGWQPLLVHDIGFQLSVGAVIGIWAALFAGRHWWQARLPSRPMPWLLLGTIASLGAGLVTGPIVAYHFGLISFVSIIANLLIIPTVPVYMALIIFMLVMSVLLPVGADLGGFAIHVVWEWWEMVTFYLTRVPGAYIAEASLPLWAVIGYEGLLVLAGVFWMRKYRISWREIWI